MCCKSRILAQPKDLELIEHSVCDKSVRYVAQENIEPVSLDTEPSEAITRLAGRHFKRWDSESHLFVSNVRDEYPDN